MRRFLFSLSLSLLALPVLATTVVTHTTGFGTSADAVVATCPSAAPITALPFDSHLPFGVLTMKVKHGNHLVHQSEIWMSANGQPMPMSLTRTTAYPAAVSDQRRTNDEDASPSNQASEEALTKTLITPAQMTEGLTSVFRALPVPQSDRILVAYEISMKRVNALPSYTAPNGQTILLPVTSNDITCGHAQIKPGQTLTIAGFQPAKKKGFFASLFHRSAQDQDVIEISWKPAPSSKASAVAMASH